jgi:undecaprenyl-diphosphatase
VVTRLVVPAATALLVLTLAVVLRATPVLHLDALVSADAYRAALEHPAWRATMYAVTRTADATSLTPVAVVGALLLMWGRRWRQAWLIPAAMLGAGVARLVVLNVVDRPRPLGGLAPASGWSFPSGHTTGSAAAAAIVIVVCWPMLRGRLSRTLLISLAGGWAAAVAVSRVALVVHWPSDILGAWLLVAAVVPTVAVLLGAWPSGTADRARSPQRGTM